MVNKKAWLKAVEVTLAILLVLGVALLLQTTQKSPPPQDPSDVVVGAFNTLLDDNSVRENIISKGEITIAANDTLKEILNNQGYSFQVTSICEVDGANGCKISPPKNKEIYAYDRIISWHDGATNFKKIKIYVWIT